MIRPIVDVSGKVRKRCEIFRNLAKLPANPRAFPWTWQSAAAASLPFRYRLAAALLLMLAASACEIVPPPGPPEWQAAFHDGCNSAGAAQVIPGRNYVKNQEAYQEVGSMYRMGWDDGWTTCTAQAKAVRPSFGVGVTIPVR